MSKRTTSAAPKPMVLHRIRELREERALDQQALATRAGLDKRAMSRIETGITQLDVPKMRQISKALGVKPSELLLAEDTAVTATGADAEALEAIHAVPAADRPRVIQCARQLVDVMHGMIAAGETGLAGRVELAAKMSSFWNQIDDVDRSNVLTILDSAGFAERSQRFRR